MSKVLRVPMFDLSDEMVGVAELESGQRDEDAVFSYGGKSYSLGRSEHGFELVEFEPEQPHVVELTKVTVL